MKSRLSFVSFLSSAVLLVAVASPTAAFDAAHLAGAWHGISLNVLEGDNSPQLFEYAFEIDAEGDISGTITVYSTSEPSETLEIVSGHFDISATGAIDASRVEVQAGSYYLPPLQMNSETDFLAGSGEDADDGSTQISLFAKVGDSYAIADMEGVWEIVGFAEQIGASHFAQKIRGDITLNDQGETDAVGYIQFEGNNAELIPPGGLTVEIDASGAFHTEPDFGGDLSMQLAEGKTLAVGRAVGWEEFGRGKQQIYVLVKTASGAVATDMAGEWFVKTFFDQGVADLPGFEYGEVTVNAAGTAITEGLVSGSQGTEEITSGTVATDDQGAVVLGDVTYYKSGIVATSNVYLEAGREVFAGHSSDSEFDIGLIVGIQVPEPDAVLLVLASLTVLAGLRRPSTRSRDDAPSRSPT